MSAGTSTVLVVDDDSIICDLIGTMLAKKGYDCRCACNGKEALEYLRKASSPPKLILLDLMMPVMTGWEFRKIQQGDPKLARIPVAIITGLPEMKKEAEAIGAVDVLAKPSRVEHLTTLVSRFCGACEPPGRRP